MPVIDALETVPAPPAWDPPVPRPPSLIPSAIALVLILVLTVAGLIGLRRALAAKYSAKADLCGSVDVGALTTMLGERGSTVKPSVASGSCSFSAGSDQTAPAEYGTVSAEYDSAAVAARFHYAIGDDPGSGRLPGFDDDARVTDTTDSFGGCAFQAVVLDSNLVLTMSIKFIPTGTATPSYCGRSHDVLTALAASVRGTLVRLS
jgi:hypothetical protein